jgi:hypothetical protein
MGELSVAEQHLVLGLSRLPSPEREFDASDGFVSLLGRQKILDGPPEDLRQGAAQRAIEEKNAALAIDATHIRIDALQQYRQHSEPEAVTEVSPRLTPSHHGWPTVARRA